MRELFIKNRADKLKLIEALKKTDMPYRVRILNGGGRSADQNRYLFGGCYDTILKEGGEAMRGWTTAELHEYFCGEYFGWQTLQGFGRPKMKPVRTTTTDEEGKASTLSKTEFVDFTEFVRQRAADHGVIIEDPYVED